MSINFKRIFKMKLDELRTIITEAGGCGNALFSDSENLLDLGILDSLGIITLAELLEDRNISFSPSRIPHDKFTLIGICEYINSIM